MQETNFSIIICVDEAAALLEKSLASILRQTFFSYEVLVINKNNYKQTKKIIEQYKEKMGANLRWMNLKEANQQVAMNEGVKMARGKYVTFLQVGEEITADSLTQALACAQKYPQADVVYGVENIWEKSKQIKGRLNAQAETLPIKNKFPSHLYYRKDLHRQFGFYGRENKVIEDYTFCLKAFYLGQAIVRPFDLISRETIGS